MNNTPRLPPQILLLASVFGLISVIYLGLFCGSLPVRAGYPLAISTIEPQPLAGALRVARGQTLYQPYIGAYPSIPITYGVLTYWIPGTVCSLLSSEAPTTVLRAGRAQTIVSTLALIVVLGLLTHQRGVPWRFAFLSAMPLFWFPFPAEWLVKFMPDAPALALSLAGWCVAGPPVNTKKPFKRARLLRLAAGVLLWTAAFHYKPTVLAGPIAFGCEALFAAWSLRAEKAQARRILLAPIFACAILVASVLVTVLVLQAATHGEWRNNTIDSMRAGNVHIADPRFALASLRWFGPALGLQRIVGAGVPVLLGGLGVLLLMLAWAATRLRAQPMALAVLASFAIDLLLLTKAGSNINYLLGTIALWGVLAAVHFFSTNAEDHDRCRPMDLALLVPIALLLALDVPRAMIPTFELTMPTIAERDLAAKIVKETPADQLLVLDPVWGIPEGLNPPFADSYHASLLHEGGRANNKEIVDNLRVWKYQMVIGNNFTLAAASYHGIPLLPSDIHKALREAYTPTERGTWLVFWKPKFRQSGS